MSLRHPLFCLALLALGAPLLAHYSPMIEAAKPVPPPTVDPGPNAALLKVRVIDKATGKTVSATACINRGAQEPDRDPYRYFSLRVSANRQKGPIRFRPLDYYFFTDSVFQVRVPPGKLFLEVCKGYEYVPYRDSLDLGPGETVILDAALERWIDMAGLGWYSGDTHIHMERTGVNDDTLLTVTSARDIRYAYILAMNTDGYDGGGKYAGWLQFPGLGEKFTARAGPYHLVSGQEYRSSTLGHVTILIPDSYVPGVGVTDNVNQGPSLAVIADQTHDLRGFIGLAHGGYYNQEADALLLESKMDFLELLQFGGYRCLGLDGWYDFLNLGYRLPVVGACDFPYCRELGSEITYVWSEKPPTVRSFAESLAQGKSFATSGPMLFLEVEGRRPGGIISLARGADTIFTVVAGVASQRFPVRTLEIIVNGWVAARQIAPEGRTRWDLTHTLRVRESCWVAARTYSEAGTDAHTNPVYIYVGGKLPFHRDSARQVIARLEGSIETIPEKNLVDRIVRIKSRLENFLKGAGPDDFPLPGVPAPGQP